MRIRASLVLGLVGAAAGAWADEVTVTLSPTPFEMPRSLGPLVAEGAPHKYDDPRLGVSYQFSGPGASLTIYVYDAGYDELPDGPDTIPTCGEFESAKDGVLQSYQNVRLVSEQMVRMLPPRDAPLMREAKYELTRDGRDKVSYVWITSALGQFLKLRFTMDAQYRDEMPEARRAILSAVGTAIEPHLKPADPDAEKPGASIGLNADSFGGSDDTLGAGFMYLMFLTALADEDSKDTPVCGGPVVPSYDSELTVQRAVFVEDEAGRKSRYGKLVSKVEKAGFLEEFVWVELHREGWGESAPPGLTLPEYQAWKKKKLRKFQRPDFGTVTVDHPRALPLEPPDAP